ncbi:MAG: DUF4198 domain-containing protein [Acidobacteriota bacterium]
MIDQRRRIAAWPRCAFLVLLLSCGVLGALPASAHDVWLAPRGPVAPDQPVRLELRIGHLSDEQPNASEVMLRDGRRIDSLRVHAPDGRSLEPPGLDGSALVGAFRPTVSGTWIVAFVGRPFFNHLDTEEFSAYLDEEGMQTIAAEHARRGLTEGREWVSRSVKTLVQVGDPSMPPSDRAIGLPVELVLRSLDDSTLELEVQIEGRPAPGQTIELRHLNGRQPGLIARADANGRAHFSVVPGPFLATALHMRPARPDDSAHAVDGTPADWRSIFAASTFVVPTLSPPGATEIRP